MSKYRIVYFSGTGCTALAANCLGKALRELGCETCLERITAGGSSGVITADTGREAYSADTGSDTYSADALVLLFPVYACTVPGPVIKWLENLSRADGMPTAVISVSGGGEISPNTASRVSAVKILERKGFDVLFEDSIVMLSNFIVATPEPLSIMLLQVLPEKVRAIADGLLSGGRKRMPPRVIDRLFARAGKTVGWFAKKWGRSIKVSDGCDGCGLCAEQCPTSNITMEGMGVRPNFGEKCCMCLGCFYTCPKRALMPKTAKSIIVEGFNLKEAEEKASASDRADAAQIPAGLIWLGVKKYLKEI